MGGVLLSLHSYTHAQEIDITQYIQDVLSRLDSAATPAATSSAITLRIIPNPAQTRDIVIATAELSNPALAAGSRFTWYVNGALKSDLSGLGQSTAVFVAPETPGTLSIRVTMDSPTASSTATAIVELHASPFSHLLDSLQSQANTLIEETMSAAREANFTIERYPERPKPSETMTFTLKSFQFNPADAEITWLVNGSVAKEGRGETTLMIAAGAEGSFSEIEAQVEAGGRSGTRSVTFAPASIRFYWWADTYTPAWYRGKALGSPGARIFIEAIPSFPEAIRNVLTYTWSIDGRVIRGSSGTGKSVLSHVIPAPSGFQPSISVRVTNAQKTIDTEAHFVPPHVPPEALVYEIRPLAGVNTATAIQSVDRPAGKTVELIVEPFYVPRPRLASLDYRWQLNGTEIDAEENDRPRSFTLASTPETTGVQSMNISFEDRSGNFIADAKAFSIHLK